MPFARLFEGEERRAVLSANLHSAGYASLNAVCGSVQVAGMCMVRSSASVPRLTSARAALRRWRAEKTSRWSNCFAQRVPPPAGARRRASRRVRACVPVYAEDSATRSCHGRGWTILMTHLRRIASDESCFASSDAHAGPASVDESI